MVFYSVTASSLIGNYQLSEQIRYEVYSEVGYNMLFYILDFIWNCAFS
jgi:hypothetical protein